MRDGLACLVVVPVLCVVGLASASPAGATPTPPTADPALVGTWTNVNTSSPNLDHITITSDGAGGLLVEAFGHCTPLCDVGQVSATIYAPPGSTDPGRSFATNQDDGFKRLVLLGQLTSGHHPKLNVDEFSVFTDGSGRRNYSMTERFVKSADQPTGAAGTPVTDYVAGDQPHPASSLVGTWTNTSADSQGILELDITRAADGTLLVHELGACHPDPCDNGTVPAIAYGRLPDSANASRCLAAFDFPFLRELDAPGHGPHAQGRRVLRVHRRLGRPNYTQVETFTR